MTSITFPYIQRLAMALPAASDAIGLSGGSSAQLRFPAAAAAPCEIEWEAIRTGGRLLMFGYSRLKAGERG